MLLSLLIGAIVGLILGTWAGYRLGVEDGHWQSIEICAHDLPMRHRQREPSREEGEKGNHS